MKDLYASLTRLTEEIDRIKASGEVYRNAWIDSATPSGNTVKGSPTRQYRLRMRGRKATYLHSSKVAETRAAIQRGKAIDQLEKSIKKINDAISAIERFTATKEGRDIH